MSNNSDWYARQLGGRAPQQPQQLPPQFQQVPPQYQQPYPPQYQQQPPVYPPPQFQQQPVYPPQYQQYPPQPPQYYPPQPQYYPQQPQNYPPQQYGPMPGQKLSEYQGYEHTPPKSANSADLCPDCNSRNYSKVGKTPPSQAGPGQDIWRCYDCGYPVKQTTSGMGGFSQQSTGPTMPAKQVPTGGFNPQGIIGHI